jgi:hypothetical protein
VIWWIVWVVCHDGTCGTLERQSMAASELQCQHEAAMLQAAVAAEAGTVIRWRCERGAAT